MNKQKYMQPTMIVLKFQYQQYLLQHSLTSTGLDGQELGYDSEEHDGSNGR